MLTGRKLLLADDSLTIQKVISLTFGDEGMTVSTVSSGAQALEWLARDVPDVVLADVLMPAPDGYRVCELIKRDPRLRHVPVLLLAGTFEPFDQAEARRVGADDVLTKPFQSIRELVNKVGGLLGGHADEQPPDADAAAHTAAAPEAAAADRASAAAPEAAATPPAGWAPAPANSFADLDLDDQTIQSTPAEVFGRHGQPAASDAAPEIAPAATPAATPEATPKATPEATAAPLVLQPDESAHDHAATGESFLLLEAEDDEEEPAAPAPAGGSTAPDFAPAATAGFNLRSAHTSDDALLDLAEAAPTAPAGPREDSEFILDLGEDSAAAANETAAATTEPAVLYADGLASSPAEAAAPLFAADLPHTDAHALANPDPTAQPVYGQAAAEIADRQAAAQESAPVAAAGPAAAAQLAPETIDAIARRVVELLSDQAIREIAWEIVPELAERLIRQRLAEEQPQH